MPTHVSAVTGEATLLHLNNEKGRPNLNVLSAFWNVTMIAQDIESTGFTTSIQSSVRQFAGLHAMRQTRLYLPPAAMEPTLPPARTHS